MVQFRDGKCEGPQTRLYINGQKQREGTFKDRERDGLYTEYYYPNGQKSLEITFKDGKMISKLPFDKKPLIDK